MKNKLFEVNNTTTNISNAQILNNNIPQPSQTRYNSISQNIVLGPSSKTKNQIPQSNIVQFFNQTVDTNNAIYLNNQDKIGMNIQTNVPEKHVSNVFASILKNNETKNDMNINDNNSNIFDATSNKKVTNTMNINSMNNISPILENRAYNQNNSNQSNNSSFNHDINNLNTAAFITKENTEISNPFVNDNLNNNPSKNKRLINDNNTYNNLTIKITTQPNQASSNLNLTSPFSHAQNTINNPNVIKINNDSNIGIKNINNGTNSEVWMHYNIFV